MGTPNHRLPWTYKTGAIIDVDRNIVASRYSKRHMERPDGYGDIAPWEADENARLIVEAVNAHDTLRARVAKLEAALRDVLAESAAPSNPCDASMYHAVCRAGRAALGAKGEGT